MGEKILTISIAAYNVEKYLNRTLKSLICSPDVMKQLEVIIVDDGSSDCTSTVAQEYVEQYPDTFVLIKKDNGGHGSTLNAAAYQARGKYFRMLDGDDWYDTEQLEKFVLKLKDIDVDCVITPYRQIYVNKIINIDTHDLENRKKYVLNEVMDVFAQNRFSSELMATDFAIKTDILRMYGFRLLEKCMYTDKEYDLFAILHSRTFMKLPYFVYQYRLGDEEQSVGDIGRKKYLWDPTKVVFSMLKTLAQKKNYIVSDNHKFCLYHYVFSTTMFFADSLLCVCDELNVENTWSDFVQELERVDEEFAQYLVEKPLYRWWNWLFSLRETLEQKKCVIFGAGQYGKRILQYLKNIDNEPEAFIDNNMQMWDTEKYGCMVESPSQLLSKYSQDQIIISVKNYTEQIEEQLLSMGVSPDRIIVFRK